MEGELGRSIPPWVRAMAFLGPSPVMVLTPVLGEAATTSWPPWRRMATVFEPIRPVPPMTTIFMVYPPLSMTGDPQMGSNASEERYPSLNARAGDLSPVAPAEGSGGRPAGQR